MQLAHLLPFLDAEIERLQKARDLLALKPSPLEIYTETDTEQLLSPTPLRVAPEDDKIDKGHQAAGQKVSQPPVENPLVIASSPSSPPAVLPKRLRRSRTLARTELHTDESHAEKSRKLRRKPLMLPDTALRGHVPSGPVVVSAEEVRKSQASKTAQTSRAAEVRRAGEEPGTSSSFRWRTPSSDARTVDSLLQRLMSIGTETEQRPQGSSPRSNIAGT